MPRRTSRSMIGMTMARLERWADQGALDAHFASPHMAAFNTAMAGAKVTGASVKSYTAESLETLLGG